LDKGILLRIFLARSEVLAEMSRKDGSKVLVPALLCYLPRYIVEQCT